ncbi:hypothetical protein ACRHK7_07330 [Weissella tructae]|uniref:Uncharacterized protein n=2 Tax=Weissella TaxID=46255 RepID=A0A075U5F7_9LACO|nr:MULTISPECIES: hypothetical protein [Weissella]AIG65362.1 hypothetical protein WS08_0423 [Weissella tructae]AIM62676.1 hypothetical protein WS74_0424 [Weissella ceti]AIM64011.1 hypothetical protein WS105_0421 [Weissella ceti]ELA07178.1 hypothetical protein WCNC_06342 [Weissella ceti NC36]QVV91743.1 hypothetical protein KHQ32_02385 [Weissella tructae]
MNLAYSMVLDWGGIMLEVKTHELLYGWNLNVPEGNFEKISIFMGPHDDEKNSFSFGVRLQEHGMAATAYISIAETAVTLEEVPFMFKSVTIDSLQKYITIELDVETA